MFTPPDYSLLDLTPAGRSMFYPRRDWWPPPVGATDHSIPVDEGVAVAVRFYRYSVIAPTILFFHGNGEVAPEYDETAQFYRQIGVNLIVADYRWVWGERGPSIVRDDDERCP